MERVLTDGEIERYAELGLQALREQHRNNFIDDAQKDPMIGDFIDANSQQIDEDVYDEDSLCDEKEESSWDPGVDGDWFPCTPVGVEWDF